MKNILITGGAGFIGSHLVKHFVRKYPDYRIINIDALTYAGNLENISEIESFSNYIFERVDIRDINKLNTVFRKYYITDVIHLAAESHVDNSIENPLEFIETNINGTANLVHVAYKFWKDNLSDHRFYHVSTDEVFGALDFDSPLFTEETKYDPHSPYSASKASSDFIVKAFHDTFEMNTVISHCSNNYGTHQYPEKLIPVVINKLMQRQNIPVYGNGKNVRDWLLVTDHVSAIDILFHEGKSGETYNIGGNNEVSNIDLVKLLCRIYDDITGENNSESLITYVTDRKGHDLRYGIDSSKLQNNFNWKPTGNFVEELTKVIKWYIEQWKA